MVRLYMVKVLPDGLEKGCSSMGEGGDEWDQLSVLSVWSGLDVLFQMWGVRLWVLGTDMSLESGGCYRVVHVVSRRVGCRVVA